MAHSTWWDAMVFHRLDKMSDMRLCEDDIHYAPPGYLTSVEEVARAIEMAKHDLAGYGIMRFPA